MISIGTRPTGYNWSKNSIVINASTNKYLSNAGTKSSALIRIDSYTGLMFQTLRLKCNVFDQLFTFNQVQPDSATNIKYDSTVVDNATATAYIIKRLRQNYFIKQNFIVQSTTTNNILSLDAINYGSDYSLTATYTTSAIFVNTGGGQNRTGTSVKILIQVYKYPSLANTFKSFATLIGQRSLIPDSNGNITEDLADIIDDYLEARIPSSIGSSAITSSIGKFYIGVSEVGVEVNTGDASINEIGIINETEDFFVICGGVSKQDYLTSFSLDYELTSQTNNFLSNYTGEKNISIDTNEILFVLPQLFDASTLKVKVTYTFNDGTSGFTTPINLPAAYQLWQIPVGFQIYNLPSFETADKKIVKFNICIVTAGSGNEISSKFYYKVDRKYYKNKTSLCLQNSRGGFEVFIARGEIKRTINNTFTTISKVLPAQIGYTSFEQDRIGTQYSELFIINTGHLKSRDEKRWLSDLLLTGRGCIIINNIFYPIIITATTIVQSDTTEQIFSYDIEFMFSLTNESYNSLKV